MIRIVTSVAILFASTALAPAPVRAEPRTYVLDSEHITIAFMVTHIGFAKVLGVFREAEGTIVFDQATLALESMNVTVNTQSIDTGHNARDRHIRSRDFLDAVNYPEMVFVLTGAEPTGAEPTGERTGIVTGNLTLRGETRPVRLDVVWNKAGEYPYGDEHYTLGISARGEIQRSQWGMTYAIDNGLVGDAVEIIIEAELIRQD